MEAGDVSSVERTGRKQQNRKFIGFSQALEERREVRARRNKPPPWIVQKFMIGVVVAIACYAWYVYIAVFCVPMIRQDDNALGGRRLGVVFLVIFCVLGLMFWWTYIKVILTPPGYAKDYIKTSPHPQMNLHPTLAPAPTQSPLEHYSDYSRHASNDSGIGGPPYEKIRAPAPIHSEMSNTSDGSRILSSPSKRDPEKAENDIHYSRQYSRTNSQSSRREASNYNKHGSHESRNSKSPANKHADSNALDIRTADTKTRGERFSNPKLSPLPPTVPPHSRRRQTEKHEMPLPNDGRRNVRNGSSHPGRSPPSHPALAPEYRYCYRDELLKPMRAHHCRTCATCVLMYDHHCPWVGQCIGAHNLKFFVNFLQWCAPWTAWSFATMVGMNAKMDSNASFNANPQEIIVMVFSGLFMTFTLSLLIAHIRLIMVNQTGVEALSIKAMKSRERETLNKFAPLCACSLRRDVLKERRKMRKEWDAEWGNLNAEGHIWWLESAQENWAYRMGKNPWGWFLPIGRSEGDGLTFPVNPRFSVDGQWRRRRDWPTELR